MTTTYAAPAVSFPRSQSLTLSIIVADPLGGDRLLAALHGLRDAGITLPFEVIAVVGGHEDPALAARLRREFPLVAHYQAWGHFDLGTLYSVGARAATGTYVLTLDGSAHLSGAAMAELVLFMNKSQFVSVVSPRLESPSGRETIPGRGFPTVSSALAEFRGVAVTPVPRIQNALNRQVTTPKEVDAVTSGCCLYKRKAVEEIGYWDSGYAPGGEGLDWCLRARHKGWSVFYHPGFTAQLAAERGEDRAAIAGRLASDCRFIRKYQGLLPLMALKALLMATSLRGLMFDGGASLIPGSHRIDARQGFWRAWYILAALLAPRPQRSARIS